MAMSDLERWPHPRDHADRFRNGLGPVMRRLAQDVIDNPQDWELGGALIWRHRRTRHRVTDQAVEWMRANATMTTAHREEC
jgi:hypothetical protein